MKANRPSTTAAGIALARAIESQKSAGERICYDPFARYLVGPLFWYVFRLFVDVGYAEWRSPGVMGLLVARDRYIDDTLQSCLDAGLEQLVILGAGYDSRAYRFEQLCNRQVFEVDHLATQEDKKEKLAALLGALPEHVVFVPIDFDTQTLEQRLAESGYDERKKTLFIWQGVTQYLTPQGVDNTLAFIAHHSGQGSSVVFDYMYTQTLDGTLKRAEVSSMRRYRALTGEALAFGIPQGQIEAFLQERGFRDVRNVDNEYLHRTYFFGVNQKRKVASGYAIVSATVDQGSSA